MYCRPVRLGGKGAAMGSPEADGNPVLSTAAPTNRSVAAVPTAAARPASSATTASLTATTPAAALPGGWRWRATVASHTATNTATGSDVFAATSSSPPAATASLVLTAVFYDITCCTDSSNAASATRTHVAADSASDWGRRGQWAGPGAPTTSFTAAVYWTPAFAVGWASES